MKAIRVRQTGPPDVMKLEEVPDPAAGSGQVLVEVKAAGVNPVETYIRAGNYPAKPALPYTPGKDAAGILREVGPGVTGFRPGDRVYIIGTATGAYAQLALCNAADVYALPEKLSFAQGAAVGIPYGTAWRALFVRGQAWPGQTLLVHGASGGVGIAAVQIAKAAGLRVIGTAGTERGLALVAEQGADHVLNHHQTDYLKQLMDLTGGRGVDVILEMLANVNLDKDLGILAKDGRVVVIGSRGPVQIDARRAMTRDASILGMTLANATPSGLATIHAAIGAGLSHGTLRPVINCQLPLADAPKSHELVMSPGAYGKIVLIP
jgi:NADPH2:quinone reductase